MRSTSPKSRKSCRSCTLTDGAARPGGRRGHRRLWRRAGARDRPERAAREPAGASALEHAPRDRSLHRRRPEPAARADCGARHRNHAARCPPIFRTPASNPCRRPTSARSRSTRQVRCTGSTCAAAAAVARRLAVSTGGERVKAAAAKIEALLKKAMGLHAASIGSSSVERAVRARLAACGSTTHGRLLESAEGSRSRAAGAHRGRRRSGDLVLARPRSVRGAHARCARGMAPEPPGRRATAAERAVLDRRGALLDGDGAARRGFSGGRFVIDAVDISERSLDLARRGIYGKHSFRGTELAFRDRYFEPVAEGRRVNDSVRRGVRFQQGNVLADDFLAGGVSTTRSSAAISSSTSTTRRKTVRSNPAPATDGQRPVVRGARRVEHAAGARPGVGEGAAGFCLSQGAAAQRAATPRPAPALVPAKPQLDKRAPAPQVQAAPPPAPAPVMEPKRASARAAGTDGPHERGRRWPTRGVLPRPRRYVRNRCASMARRHRAPPDGPICSANGRIGAADRYYRKALYLDQNHHQSLVHLSLLLEQQGDERGAKLLRSRAQKL